MNSSIRIGLVFLIVFTGSARGTPAQAASPGSDRARLIGAWHLVSLDAPGPDGKTAAIPGLEGMLVYTRDGHVSVEIMYPQSQNSLTNDYVLNGYEASFGSFSVDQSAHTVTHHIAGSITRALVGKDLTRSYQFLGDRLIIHSVRADEHWRVTWQHD